MEDGTDSRVEPFLGRVLDDARRPVGTCFQVAPGVLGTAWHVLEDLGAGDVGSKVTIDPLRGGEPRQAVVVAVDPRRDLAVLTVGLPLTGCVAGAAATDEMSVGERVLVTGVVAVEDSHTYRFLDAQGTWAGGTTRDDSVGLGRLTASAVLPGMSGAPVLSHASTVVGVVSGRYNSADGWLRDSVWVARTEDLVPLLAGVADLRLVARGRAPEQPDVQLYLRSLLTELDEDVWTRAVSTQGRRLSVSAIARPLALAQSSLSPASAGSPDASTSDDWRWHLVLGGPGAGKSWLARTTAREGAERALNALEGGQDPAQVEIPLFAPFADIDVSGPIWSGVVRAATRRVAHRFGEADLECLERHLSRRPGRYLLVFDGLDEVGTRIADTILRDVPRMVDLRARILVTSRPGAWRNQLTPEPGSVGLLRVDELRPLRYPDDVDAVVAAWLAESPAAARRLLDTLAVRSELAEAACTPLILAMFCLLAESRDGIPERRSELYRRLVTRVLRGDWRASLDDDLGAGPREALRALALAGARDDPRTGLSDWPESVAMPRLSGLNRRDLDAVGNIAPVSYYDPDEEFQKRRFIHRSVREYLLVEQLATLPVEDAATISGKHAWFDPSWENVIPMAIASHPDRNEFASIVFTGSPNGEGDIAVGPKDGFGELRRLAVRMAAETSPADWNPRLGRLIDGAVRELRYDSSVTRDWLVIADNGWPGALPTADDVTRLMNGDVPWGGMNIGAWMKRLDLRGDERQRLVRILGELVAGITPPRSSWQGIDIVLARAFLELNPSAQERTAVARVVAERLERGLSEERAAVLHLLGGEFSDQKLATSIEELRNEAMSGDDSSWFLMERGIWMAAAVAHLSADEAMRSRAADALIDIAARCDDGGREIDYRWIESVVVLRPTAVVLARLVAVLLARLRGLDGYYRKIVTQLITDLCRAGAQPGTPARLVESGPFDVNEAGEVLGAFAQQYPGERDAAAHIIVERMADATDEALNLWTGHLVALEPSAAVRSAASDLILARLLSTPTSISSYSLHAMQTIGGTAPQRQRVFDHLAHLIRASADARFRQYLGRRACSFVDTTEQAGVVLEVAVELLAEENSDVYDFREVVENLPLADDERRLAGWALVRRLAVADPIDFWRCLGGMEKIGYQLTDEDRGAVISTALTLIARGDADGISDVLNGLKVVNLHADERVRHVLVPSMLSVPFSGDRLRQISYILPSIALPDADRERLVDALIAYLGQPSPIVGMNIEHALSLIDSLGCTPAQGLLAARVLTDAARSVGQFAQRVLKHLVRFELDGFQRRTALDCCMRVLIGNPESWYWVGGALAELRLDRTERVRVAEVLIQALETVSSIPTNAIRTLLELGDLPEAIRLELANAVVDARRRIGAADRYLSVGGNYADLELYADLVALGLSAKGALDECLAPLLDRGLRKGDDGSIRSMAQLVRQASSYDDWVAAAAEWAPASDALYAD